MTDPIDLIIPDTAIKPTLSIIAKATGLYVEAGPAADIPSTSVTADTTDVTVDVTIVVGLGVISTTASSPPTFTWTVGDKTAQIIGTPTQVNTALAALQYTPDAADEGEVVFLFTATDDNGNTTTLCGANNIKLVTDSVLQSAAAACTGTYTMTGTTGSIVAIYVHEPVDDDIVKKINTIAVPFNTSLTQTVTDLVAEITTTGTTPQFTATDLGGGTFKVCAPTGLGADANGYYLSVATTGNLAISGSPMDGGRDKQGIEDFIKGGLSDNAWKLVDQSGLIGQVLNSIADPDESGFRLGLPVGTDPITEIRYKFKGRNTISYPNTFNPTARTLSANHASWVGAGRTFTTGYTDDPAWCLLDFMTNTNYGCGDEIWAFLSTADKNIVYEDLYAANTRNIETVHSGTRYTLNGVVDGSRTKLQVLQDIAGVMHAKVLFLGRSTTNSLIGGGMVRVVQDRPRSAVNISNNTSISQEGVFYNEKNPGKIYNTAHVSWADPDKYSQLASVTTGLTIDDTVSNTEEIAITAWGINDENQAKRHGRMIMLDESSTQVLSKFIGTIDHQYLVPGDVIRLLDGNIETDTEAAGGRILSVNSTTEIEVDRDLTVTGNPNIYISLPDGTTHSTTIASYSSTNFTVTLTGAMSPITVDGAKYVVTDGALYVVTKQVRRDKGVVEVYGTTYDAAKYTTIDSAF